MKWILIFSSILDTLSCMLCGFDPENNILKKFSPIWPYVHFGVIWPDKLSPAAFEKHSGRESSRKWKNNIWVIINGEKVSLYKTVLLKYYNQVSKNVNGTNRLNNGRSCHRDEFISCTMCKKMRRFRLRTKEECRVYHDALAVANWKCSNLPYDKYAIQSVSYSEMDILLLA